MEQLAVHVARRLGATNIGMIQPWSYTSSSLRDGYDDYDHADHNDEASSTSSPTDSPTASSILTSLISHAFIPPQEDVVEEEEEAGMMMMTNSSSFSSIATNSTTMTGMDETIVEGASDNGYIPWWYTMSFIIVFGVVVCGSFLLRELFYRWCGWSCCASSLSLQHSQNPLGPSYGTGNHHRHHHRNGNNRNNYDNMTAEEIREEHVAKQRQERRLWYMYYLRPYTMMLTQEHFTTDDKISNEKILEEPSNSTLEFEMEEGRSGLSSESAIVPGPEMQDVDLSDGKDAEQCSTHDEENPAPTIPSTNHDDDNNQQQNPFDVLNNINNNNDYSANNLCCTKIITLWDHRDSCFRSHEANCPICLNDYEVGDQIVRSAADENDEYCFHVFHFECMLQWLSQGKKRCPICRHWFVPAIRIKEQMKDAEVVTNADSLHHLYDANTMEGLASIGGDTESNMSESYGSATTGSSTNEVTSAPQSQAGINTIIEEESPLHHHHYHRHHGFHRRSQSDIPFHPEHHQRHRRNMSQPNVVSADEDLESGYLGVTSQTIEALRNLRWR